MTKVSMCVATLSNIVSAFLFVSLVAHRRPQSEEVAPLVGAEVGVGVTKGPREGRPQSRRRGARRDSARQGRLLCGERRPGGEEDDEEGRRRRQEGEEGQDADWIRVGEVVQHEAEVSRDVTGSALR